jgi:dTDP-4-amino-4,6-dideoxygalactose transaminase
MGSCRREYEERFGELVGAAGARAFRRGREALLVLLKALGVREGDRVGLCGYTCLSVVEPVMLCGATPVYLDVDEHACIDPEAIAAERPGLLRVVILQHTFGVPGRLESLLNACRSMGARVVEDCAHALGSSWKGVPLGKFGDGAIYSFAWGKSYTTAQGGMLTVDSAELLEKIDAETERWALAEAALSEMLLDFQRRVFRRFVAAGREMAWKTLYLESCKRGLVRESFELGGNRYLRRGYARVAGERTSRAGLEQLRAWPRLKETRRENTRWIARRLAEAGLPPWPVPLDADAVLLECPLWARDKRAVLAAARRGRLDINGWYESPVHPLAQNDLSAAGYTAGSCVRAERLAHHLVHVPLASSSVRESVEAAIRLVGQAEAGTTAGRGL